MTPRKLFDPPLSLGEFLDHAQTIAINPSEPSEVRAAAMRALSVHLISPSPSPSPSPGSPSPSPGSPSPSPVAVAIALVLVGLAIGVLVGLVLA